MGQAPAGHVRHPGLDHHDLKLFRLLADMDADIPLMEAATQELWRRGIRDYPVAT